MPLVPRSSRGNFCVAGFFRFTHDGLSERQNSRRLVPSSSNETKDLSLKVRKKGRWLYVLCICGKVFETDVIDLELDSYSDFLYTLSRVVTCLNSL